MLHSLKGRVARLERISSTELPAEVEPLTLADLETMPLRQIVSRIELMPEAALIGLCDRLGVAVEQDREERRPSPSTLQTTDGEPPT